MNGFMFVCLRFGSREHDDQQPGTFHAAAKGQYRLVDEPLQ